jgi:hypothetical protein
MKPSSANYLGAHVGWKVVKLFKAEAKRRGYAAACSAMETDGAPDSAYQLGSDSATGVTPSALSPVPATPFPTRRKSDARQPNHRPIAR